MKKSIILGIYVVSTFTSFGQLDSAYISLIERETRRLQPSGTILYADRIPLDIVNLKSDLRWNNDLEERLRHCRANGVEVSKRDIKEIRAEMKKAFLEFIPDFLFFNSKSLPIDSLRKTVNSINRRILDSVNVAI